MQLGAYEANLKDGGTPLVALSYCGLDCAASCASYSGADPFAAMDRWQQMLREGERSSQGVMDPVLGAGFVCCSGEVVLASCPLAVGRRLTNVVTDTRMGGCLIQSARLPGVNNRSLSFLMGHGDNLKQLQASTNKI